MDTNEHQSRQFCQVDCVCGERHGQYLGHYDRMQASCGRVYWALQPKRNGHLQLFTWPGLPGLNLSTSISMLHIVKDASPKAKTS